MNLRATPSLAACLLALVLTVVTATAQTPPSSIGVLADQVVALFPKVDGDIIEVKDQTVTVALGKKDGLASGVELSVYREGRELRHPRTGVLLGRTEETVGRVLVQEVFEAYATGKITQGADMRPGDRARVSAGKVPLTVVPLVEGVKDALAEAAVNALVEALTHTGRFQIAMGDAMAASLLQEGVPKQDILEGKGLAARAGRLKLENALIVYLKMVEKKPFMDVRLLSFPGPTQVLTSSLFVPPSVRPVPRGDFSASDRDRANRNTGPKQSLLERLLVGELDAGAYSTGAGTIPLKEVAKLPFVVISLDVAVAPGDKVPRMVITDGRRVYLYKVVNFTLDAEWTWTGDTTASVFNVQLADVNNDGVLDVIVNRYHPNPSILLNSMILTTRDGKPEVLAKDINQVMLALDTTGEGVKQTLWAEDFFPTGFFKAGDATQVEVRDGRLVEQKRVVVPNTFRATGATMANIGGKSAPRVLAYVDEQSHLRVTMDNADVWRSSSVLGGGGPKLAVETQIERGGRTYIYYPEPNPIAIDLDGDGIEEIVVPQNQVPGRLAVVFKGPAGYRFQAVNSGFEGTITGLGAIPGDPTPSLVVAVTRYYGYITSSGDTQIIMTIPE